MLDSLLQEINLLPTYNSSTNKPNLHTMFTPLKTTSGYPKPSSSSPLVKTPKRDKLTTGKVTPGKKGKQSPAPCDRSQDLYKRICQGLLESTRTPPKSKILTPTKFFKSRVVATPSSDNTRRVFLSFFDEPVEYITDLEMFETLRGRSRRSAVVEMVMPLYNIQTTEDSQDDIEVVADIVHEIFDLATLARSRRSGRKIIPTVNKANREVSGISPRPSKKSKKYKQVIASDPEAYSFVKKGQGVSGKGSAQCGTFATAGPVKRRGAPLDSNPLKKLKLHVYNNPDSSDEEDEIFVSTVKPIISEEEKREMLKILGNADETEKLLGDETAKCIVTNNHIEVNVDKKLSKDPMHPGREVELEEII